MVDCIFVSECRNRLIVYEFGFILQLGQIVAGIEQKPVSLNDIVTYRTPIKNERDCFNGFMSLIITVNLVKMIVVMRLFGFF
jgi:hypothetical protein